MWIFGYGSLLWYTDFPYRNVIPGIVRGYSRRFWQLSPDHRGTTSSVGSFSRHPGRTVTLVADENGSCWGLAYEVAEEQASDTIKYLDVREKAGYLMSLLFNELIFLRLKRKEMMFYPDNGSPLFPINVYLAAEEQNPYFTGPTDERSIVHTVLKARGPSGTNIEYVLRLAECIHRMAPHINDEHLFSIERKVLDGCRQLNIHDDYLANYPIQNGKYRTESLTKL
ncbi:Glutathione-specific gamma-glutamylcyclotransferase [Dirofilaria immitis]|nr:Glutathione-specific gamma-glutamylcyclotransferase [Dirofilaria immitis]